MGLVDGTMNDLARNLHSSLPEFGHSAQDEKKKSVQKKNVLNRLNYLNFTDGTVTVTFRHKKYDDVLSLPAKPQACRDGLLECLWTDPSGLAEKLRSYSYLHLIVPDKQKLLLVKADLKELTTKGIRLALPEVCYEICNRKVKRYSCENIQVQLVQNSAVFCGSLLDFSPVAFRMEVSSPPPQSFKWINPEAPVTIIVTINGEILYSGEGKIIRQDLGQQKRSFVVRPLNNMVRRFKPKAYRSSRHKLVPSPNIIFTDPFTRKTVNLKVIDISGSGFSVEEDERNAVLLPGKIIPELSIDFSNVFRFSCRAQVVYRTALPGDNGGRRKIKCGMAILDMDLQDHVHLLGLLQQAEDGNTYVCNKVDLDELWDFFFETGFVYPEKYEFIKNNKKKFLETYERLYTQNPGIARYFIYQQNGVIYGHMAMIRFYENTWLIQHHASRKSNSYKPGLVVLNQISHYVNDIYNLYSAHLDFVCCYFRRENKFPERVFGGVARYIDNPKGCSIDYFAYFHYKGSSIQWDLSGPWMLNKIEEQDLAELTSYYEHESGGLMLNAMDMTPSMVDCGELRKEYEKLGLKRERSIFSLKKDGALKAVIMVNITDTGLNMSDLTNCMKVIVLDENDLPKDTLYRVLSILSVKFEQRDIPVLLYPAGYAEKQFIPCEKVYSFWVLNLQYLDKYFGFCEKMMAHAWQE